MRKHTAIAVILIVAACAAGCAAAPSASVPTLPGATANLAAGGNRTQALHAAAQCIRDHGVPAYQDPVVAPNGDVYTDQRSLQSAGGNNRDFVDRIRTACQTLFTQADFNPNNEPKATPALVQAGVQAAQCMRAHGLPLMRDPTASTVFTPGHGFGLTQDEVPPGGKASGVMQQAMQVCRAKIDAEINASTLSSLSHG